MTEKKELQYTAPNGEIIEDIREDRDINQFIEPFLTYDPCAENTAQKSCKKKTLTWKISSRKQNHKIMRGWIRHNSLKTKVIFEVLSKTGEKDGFFAVLRPENLQKPFYELFMPTAQFFDFYHYTNNLLHGDAFCFNPDGTLAHIAHYTKKKDEKLKLPKREKDAKNQKNLRQLFSDASVKEAIKTGSLLKVKTAMTRALRKKEMGE